MAAVSLGLTEAAQAAEEDEAPVVG